MLVHQCGHPGQLDSALLHVLSNGCGRRPHGTFSLHHDLVFCSQPFHLPKQLEVRGILPCEDEPQEVKYATLNCALTCS